MKHKLTHLLVGSTFLLLLTIMGCGKPSISSQEGRKKERQEEIEQHREKLDLQVQETLIGDKRLKLQITNNGKESVDLTQYSLKIQVTDVRNAKGEQKAGNVKYSSKGKGFSIIGSYNSGPDGIVAAPYAISDKHLDRLGPNVTDEINDLVISTDSDATKATVKYILEPLHPSDSRTERIEKTITWEIGDQMNQELKDVKISIKDNKIDLSYSKEKNKYELCYHVSILNQNKQPINLKDALYRYKYTLTSSDSSIYESHFAGKQIGNEEAIFLAQGEAYTLFIHGIGLGDMTKEDAENFLQSNSFSIKFSIETSSGELLVEKEQSLTYTK
jgi:uncharacterized protein affecting Mg2+/Co2+ transport